MSLPDISRLSIGHEPLPSMPILLLNGHGKPRVVKPPDEGDRYLQKLELYAKSLPYSIEPLSKMQEMLDFIILRIVQCVEAKDFDVGLCQWDSMLTYWSTLKYPIPKEKRIALAQIYFNIAVIPGISSQTLAMCADGFKALTRSKKKLSIKDFRLPWRPMFDVLSKDLFLARRQFEYTQLSWCMGYMAENSRRFFHPACIDEMLATFLPLMNGANLDTILATEYYLTTFLPLSHPQSYLPAIFKIWESMNSYKFDERMLHFLAKLVETHVSPAESDPRLLQEIPDDELSEGEQRPKWFNPAMSEDDQWLGIFKDVGIFSDHEWQLLMCKVLASMGIPLADGGSLTTGPSTDSQAGFEIGRLPQPSWRISSLSRIIVYSMAPDSVPAPASNAPTPFFTPLPSARTSPSLQSSTLPEYLSAPISKGTLSKTTYIAGCRALDSLARLIASMESFFHPSNSGAWTADLSAFLKYLVADFNKRWHEEQQPDCDTPRNRRLTKDIKRELVKSLRTVTLLAMFSQDTTTVSNIQSTMKSMSTMEPDLILHPILERAVPALETLIETQRTTAVIKALGAVAPSLVSRQVYYPGAKYLIPILQLLIPGIDLNDPSKTLCTCSFLIEISQYIRFGDLTEYEENPLELKEVEKNPTLQSRRPKPATLPSFDFSLLNGFSNGLSSKEEDAMLRDTTSDLTDWVANFIRRVILLLENLPEEGPNGSAGGTTEVQVVDAVAGACSQICAHLSEPLYNLTLNMVYDYASTTVRSNAVRAIHQLVECVANADASKTLDKFFWFCDGNIRTELENGASSVRTTRETTPLASDATLHWNLAILRGTVYNDGLAVLKFKAELIALIRLLHEKTLSKRAFSWTGKLLSSMLLTLTHTYPLENKFVNIDEWNSEGFRRNHHRFWGRLYKSNEVKISWHIPSAEEIDFALEVFRELVEPTLDVLCDLLAPEKPRDAQWRNEFCRHLTFVRNAFSGIPTLYKEYISEDELDSAKQTGDILYEIPEMIASIDPVNCGFCLTDPSDERYKYIVSLRNKFGRFLHDASVSLTAQGQENTLDAVQLLVRSIRTFMTDYADSRDSYFINEDQYSTEKNVARQYINQKEWPRAIWVRRARFYHSARLRWNAIERLRGPLQDVLIDDVVEWSMWHYPAVRESSQSLLEAICGLYDGVRRRALPLLYESLRPGTDDDRMKGALWTLNLSSFGRYAVTEGTLVPEFVTKLLACQHNEKPSIQECVSAVAENCIASFIEPCYLYDRVPTPELNIAVSRMRRLLPLCSSPSEESVTTRCRRMVLERLRLLNEAMGTLTRHVIDVGNSERTHWKYTIAATRLLRTLVRKDVPTSGDHLQYFLQKAHDNHPSIRYYAQRAIMKGLRYLKHRILCPTDVDLILGRSQNPLRENITIQPSPEFTETFLSEYKIPRSESSEDTHPIYYDKDPDGWIAWDKSISLYRPPDENRTIFGTWDDSSGMTVSSLRSITEDSSFWEKLSSRYSEENHETSISLDNVSCVKSIFQILLDEPLEKLKPIIENLISDKEQDKQRAAAELLAGLLGGSKHWPASKQRQLWNWLGPYISDVLGGNLKTDTLPIWTSFIEYLFYRRDPRRIQPVVDFIWEQFSNLDYNSEMAFDVTKVLSLFRGFYEEMSWKFSVWVEPTLDRCWREISSEHDDVRAYIGEILAFTAKIKWQPRPSTPSVEVFVKETQTLPMEYDIMSCRGVFHKERVTELVQRLDVWREERLPGSRAFQSTYDRVGVTVCKWLFQSIHDLHASSVFDYILPLMPELLRFTEVNDNDDLASRSNTLLVRMCGVVPPRALVNPLLDALFHAIQTSPSWKVRLKALPLVQVFYFRLVPLISDIKMVQMLEVICRCLDDEVVEVREMAATTLSGILRLSPRSSIMALKDRFVRLVKTSRIPERRDPGYNRAIRQKHAAVLGICALVDSYPYTVEKWMPELLTGVLANMTYDPVPISTTVRKCASNFKKTHQDTWHEDSKRFNEDQLASLSTLLTGSSYYA